MERSGYWFCCVRGKPIAFFVVPDETKRVLVRGE